jgi:beta-carotene 3-hydroxylase
MTAVLLVVGAFAAMEAAAAASHRLLMHGRGFVWHRAHHRARKGHVDANDLFPVIFASATIGIIALGTAVPSLHALAWIGAGITAYGVAYFVVHDVCIHGRVVGRPLGRRGYLGYVRRAHAVHHATGAAPFGFLLPARFAPSATESLRARGTDARRVKTS